MSGLISVLIVDDNKAYSELMEKSLNEIGGIEVVGTTGDGVSAIDMIHELEPDLVLLDVILPKLDGLGVLEWISKEKPLKTPLFLACTAIRGDNVVQRALELGADYYMLKPVDINLLATRIKQLYNEKYSVVQISAGCVISRSESVSNQMEQITANLIKNMGIKPNLAGYNYLREAIMLAIEKPERLKSISKSIYSELAGIHNTKARNIERAIRCAIDSVCKDKKSISSSVGSEYIVINGERKPNNVQIISFLSNMAVDRHNNQLS